jgi:hypothetical protein
MLDTESFALVQSAKIRPVMALTQDTRIKK